MSGLQQLQYLSWALYLLIFVLVLLRALRRPTPAHFDMVLFFGAAGLIIVSSTITSVLGISQPPVWLADIRGGLLMSLAYLLLRLVGDFMHVHPLIMRAAEAGLALSVIALVVLPSPLPPLGTLLLVGYFVAVVAYDTWAFAREAGRTAGVTRRRMQAVAAGSACIGGVLFLAGLAASVESLTGTLGGISVALGLASGIFYFIGFAPPIWLRRAWQEPELRAFLSRAASLPRLPDTEAIVRELERGAAASLGAPAAAIGLWDADLARLHFLYTPPPAALPTSVETSGAAGTFALRDNTWELEPGSEALSGRVFVNQRAQLFTDVMRADPANAELYRAYDARAALAAPITAGDRKLGVLVIYAPRAPIFANSDLELVQLLADQAAVILESRALIDQAARVRAREEATRLKDDFLSSAAHDLKTPLTGLVTQAQLLQRRADRNPTAPVDRVGLGRLVEQSMRLKDLVTELLDVSRLEQGSLVGEREPTDVRELVRGIVAREAARWGRVQVELRDSTWAFIDAVRVDQVITNLVENALKYSPDGGEVSLRVWRDGSQARLAVQDRGIGIPLEDQPLVFERFHRARNVDDRRFAGMGLGLYIARGIVEQHGGRIWVDSAPGVGSTFHVSLPVYEREGQQPSAASPSGLRTVASA
jgi:signal transduction histidine kinase